MTTRYIPKGNQIVVAVDNAANVSPGGIHMIDRSLPIPRNATVVRVGAGKVSKKGVRIPIEFKAGDRVYLDVAERVEVNEGSVKLHVLSADSVLGLVTQTP